MSRYQNPKFLEPMTLLEGLEGGEEVAPTTIDDTACLQETDRAPPTSAKVNKMCKKLNRSMAMGSGAMGAHLKRNPTCGKAGIKENYSWVHPCLIIKGDETTGKQIVVAIWVTCRLCKFKSLDCKAYRMKKKPGNCLSWTECIKHMENIHYFLDQKDLEETLADLRVHWDSLEESMARKRRIETEYQGQSTSGPR